MNLRVALLAGAAAGLLAATQPISDTDLFWHLALGRETLASGFVRADIFSWTVNGAPVSTDQWLGQVALYGAYAAMDWRGIAILRVIAVTALVALVVLGASYGRSIRPLAAVAAAIPALGLTRALWVDRPELFGLVFFAALLLLLRIARSGGEGSDDRRPRTDHGRRRPPALAGRRPMALVAVVLVIGFWAQVHGSFALGAVLAVLVCAEGALRDRASRRAYLLTIAGTVVATLLTPAGVATWTAPGSHFLSPPRDIQEWALIDVSTPLGVAYVITLALVLACALVGRRPDIRELVVLLPVMFLSLTAVRQAPLLAIAAAPLFADRASPIVERLLGAGSAKPPPRWAVVAPVVLLLGLAAAIAPARPDERAYPTQALASLPSGPGTLARYEWGGWLIWRAPGTPVFIDGRLTPYSGGVLDDYRKIVAAQPGWEDIVAGRAVRTLLVMPSDPVAVRARELGWHEIATGEGFLLIAVP